MTQQQRERQDHRQRIGDARARNVRRAAVDRLVQPQLAVAQRCRGEQPDRSDAHRRLIGENIAEQIAGDNDVELARIRSEEHTSELQSLMRISYAVFCLKKKKQQTQITYTTHITKTQQHNIYRSQVESINK